MKLQNFLESLYKKRRTKVHKYAEFPPVIQQKIVKIVFLGVALVAFAFVLAWNIAKTSLQDALMYGGVGVVMALVLSFLARETYMIAASGEYDVFSGICTSNTYTGTSVGKAWGFFKKARTIEFEDEDGTAYTLYCKETGSVVKIGFPIKVYVSRKTQLVQHDGSYVIFQYLGVEGSSKRNI
jgi:hypothetical protein